MTTAVAAPGQSGPDDAPALILSLDCILSVLSRTPNTY